jgi:transposase-like protein
VGFQERAMRERVVYQYSECFKREVVAALSAGRFGSVYAAQEHYGIKGACTIGRWLRRYRRQDLQAKVVRVEKPGEADRMRELRQQVAQLQRALGQTQAENLLHAELLKMACQRLGEEVEAFKKKHAGTPSTGLSKGTGGGPT